MGQLRIIVCGIFEGFLRLYVDFSWLAFRVVHVVMLKAYDYITCMAVIEVWLRETRNFHGAHLPLFFLPVQ